MFSQVGFLSVSLLLVLTILLQYSLRTLVSKATTDDDTPTPGYLYNDISSKGFSHLSV